MHYTLQEAKAKFQELVKMACAGEEVIICRGKHPVVKLERLSATDRPAPARKALGDRTAGAWKGKISWTEHAFPNLSK
jgi:antitoxin (DNA-binding transcriptional repressor) of toxin-antitoxin stability system